MAFQLSPGVLVVEKDLTGIVPAVATSIGGYVGAFQWGPVNEIKTISNEAELVRTFGKPNDEVAASFFSAANFLSYSNNLKTVRVVGSSALNATADGSGLLIPNEEVWEKEHLEGANGVGSFAARCPGVLGNSIKVSLADWSNFRRSLSGTVTASTGSTTVSGTNTLFTSEVIIGETLKNSAGTTIGTVASITNNTTLVLSANAAVAVNNSSVSCGPLTEWEYKNEFDSAPGTSNYVNNLGGLHDEMHMVVVDSDGLWTGAAGTILEKFAFVSKAADARKSDGSNSYYAEVLRGSRYVFWMDHIVEMSTTFGDAQVAPLTDIITINNHPFLTGDLVKYTNGGGTDVDGLTDGETYYVIKINANSIKLALTQANALAGTAIDLDTGATGTSHLLSSVTNWGSPAQNTTFNAIPQGSNNHQLLGGVSNDTPSQGDILGSTPGTGWDLFANPEKLDVNLLITGPHSLTVGKSVIEIAELRMDCIAFVSPSLASVQNNSGDEATDIISERQDAMFNVNSSYGVMDSGWKYQYDKYNDKYRWVPLNADIAGLCARTDNIADPWFSPGGLNRGQIKNVVKLAFSPDKTDRDNLYKAGINPVVSFTGEGTVLFGDKTLLAKPSAFDRINVRRLFIVLEKAIATAGKYQLFEFNDVFTRAQFRNLVEPFLRDVKGRRGIFDFRVVCDETNNTGEVIDRNEFVADIYIKPARSINFMQLNFIATRTGVSFEEVVGA